jgi:hypothetical protein
MLISLVIPLSFLVFFLSITFTSGSNLRYLVGTETTNTTTLALNPLNSVPLSSINSTLGSSRNITTIPLFLVPKCRNNDDCSKNGYCDTVKGQCVCNTGYQTLIQTSALKDARNKIPFTHVNNTNSTANSTVDFDIVQLTNDEVKFCNYEQKKQLTAFLLSFFVGFGAEHFYMDRNKVGAAKIVYYVFCCAINIMYFILAKCTKNGKRFTEFIGTFEAFYLSCGFIYMILWNIYDWVHIGYNDIVDGYGFPLMPWK